MWLQNTVNPPNRINTFTLRNFSGGINNKVDILQEHEAYRLLNMSFDDDGLMVKRKGQVYYNGISYGSPVKWIDEFMPYTDTDKLIVSTDSKLYVDGVNVKTVNSSVVGVNFNGRYFFTDNTNMYVYGKYPLVTTTYEMVLGTSADTYQIFEVVNPPQGYTPLGTTHNTGKTVYDYINKQVWYEPCQKELEDTSKGFNVQPKSFRFLISYNGRLIASGSNEDDDNVFISDVRNPFYFPATLPIQLPPNSDKIVGLCIFDSSIVIGRQRDMYKINGMTNNPDLGLPLFTLERINTHTGLSNNGAMRVVNSYLFFLGNDGVAYALTSLNQDGRTLATTIISKQLDLFKEPFNFVKADLSTAVSYYHDNSWYLHIKDKMLVYSYPLQAWTYYTGFNARSFHNMNGELIWGNDAGRVVKVADNFLDFGAPYEAYWTSKVFDMNDASRYKQFKDFFVVAHTFSDKMSDVKLTFEVDYQDIKDEVLIKNEISIFGRARFGDSFISRNINASVPFSVRRRGRGIRFTIRNGYPLNPPVPSHAELDAFLGAKEDTLTYVTSEGKYYLRHDRAWVETFPVDLDQRMKVYQINGDYEFRGKR